MRNSQMSSLANSYGIMRKNPSSTEAMGLNPNLNIEDEYVENLLKQVHFLNLQIKLVKEKQGENKGLGIMGLLNKDQQPVVEHAIQSDLKFQTMRGNLQSTVHDLQTKNFLLEDQNLAVKAKKDYLSSVAKDTERKNFENRIAVEKELVENSEKLHNLQRRFAQFSAEANKNSENHRNVEEEYRKLILNEKIKKTIGKINEDLLGEEQGNTGNDTNEKKKTTVKNDQRLKKADEVFKADPRYLQLVEEGEQLRQKLKRSQKELFDLNYRVKEKEELKKLAERNKQVENDLKRQAEHDLERTKLKLQEKKDEFERKLNDKKGKVQAEPDLRKLQGVFTKKDRQLTDLKKKLEVSQGNFRRLNEQMTKLTLHYEQLKKDNAEIIQKQKQLIAQANTAEVELNKANIETERSELQLAKVTADNEEASIRLRKLQEELAYLTAKFDFLEKNVHLDEDMKNVRIDELRNIAQSNLVVNETISDLMTRWEQMRRFSRGPPS